MTNHQNRSRRISSPGRNPTPRQIIGARVFARLNMEEAGKVIWSTERYWYLCENGEKRMHPAMWELFLIKTKQTQNGTEAD